MRDNKVILLFTHFFPYGKGEQFLELEINYLSKAFDKVYVIPCIELSGVKRQVPNNVYIIHEFVEKYLRNSFENKYQKALNRFIKGVKAVGKAEFYKEVLDKHYVLWHPKLLSDLLFWISKANDLYSWLLDFLPKINLDFQQSIFYTYWFNYLTYGIVKLKNKFNIKVISRAHNNDLYEDRYNLPLRKQTLCVLDYVFLISEHGKRYMESLYPEYSEKFVLSKLGVEEQEFLTRPSDDDKLRIVSCSFAVPVKRVNLIIKAISLLATKYKDIKIEWHYIGDGPIRKNLEKLANDILPTNVNYYFYGLLQNRDVINFYKQKPLDVFVNASISEGIPVSIMEAQSCGIPVIATSVGGTPEIVNNENGYLLSENPSPEEIANILVDVYKSKEKWLQKRQISKLNQQSNFNASINYTEFANILKRL